MFDEESKNFLFVSRFSLRQTAAVVPAAAVVVQPLPPAKGLYCVQVGQGLPFHFEVPRCAARTLILGLPPSSSSRWGAARPVLCWLSCLSASSSWTTKRKAALAAAAAAAGQEPRQQNLQGDDAVHLHEAIRLDTDHIHIYGLTYCAFVSGKTEEWREDMRERHKGGTMRDILLFAFIICVYIYNSLFIILFVYLVLFAIIYFVFVIYFNKSLAI